jgi:hypothetical protein
LGGCILIATELWAEMTCVIILMTISRQNRSMSPDKAQTTNATVSEDKEILEYDPLEDAHHLRLLQHYFDVFSRVLRGCSAECCDQT